MLRWCLDPAVGLVLLIGSVAYLGSLPHNLGLVDEPNFLYEAKRIRDGEVLYRDVFELFTPVSVYAMALQFRLFGTDMATARLSMAVVHGLTVLAIYGTCRALAVRRSIAAAAAIAHLAVAQPTWPYVSPHWLCTALIAGLVFLCVSARVASYPRWALAAALITGLVVCTQQQRGAVIVAGMCTLLIADHVVGWRFPRPAPWRDLAARLGVFLGIVALVVVAVLGPFVVAAGAGSVIDALVAFPLVNYRQFNRTHWASTELAAAYYARRTFPLLLTYLPLILLLLCGRAAAIWLRRGDREKLQQLTAVVVFGGFSVLSIAYYPDIIHVAYIAPVLFVALAETTEWALRRVRSKAAVGTLVSLVLLTAIGWQLLRTMTRSWREFPVPYQTRFGRIDLADRADVPVLDRTQALLDGTRSKELFCYPGMSGPYLMTGARNPTRYQFFLSGYHDAAQIQEVLSILEKRQVPYVISSPFLARNDPIAEYIRQHYELVPPGGLSFYLFARKGTP